jgi:integrase/recombinase XerD
MKQLHKAIDDYLALRRELGFKLHYYGPYLHGFVSFLKKNGVSHITSKLAVEYATQRDDGKPDEWARRLIAIRGFARYRIGADPKTEIPPVGLLRHQHQRAKPYLYSEDEICRLLNAALKRKSSDPLKSHACSCLFGLLAVGGLRVGEAANLRPHDVNLSRGILTIRGAKFGKSRLVPLHPSACAALGKYAKRRDEMFAPRCVPYFFVTGNGARLWTPDLRKIFYQLSRQIGIRKSGARHGPRLHDFRHRFAIETLLRWYRTGEEIDRRMPVLSTYLGHGSPAHTYWYLGNTPELIAAASKLMEARWEGVVDEIRS